MFSVTCAEINWILYILNLALNTELKIPQLFVPLCSSKFSDPKTKERFGDKAPIPIPVSNCYPAYHLEVKEGHYKAFHLMQRPKSVAIDPKWVL